MYSGFCTVVLAMLGFWLPDFVEPGSFTSVEVFSVTAFPALLSRFGDQLLTQTQALLCQSIVLSLLWCSASENVLAQTIPTSGLDPLTAEALEQFNQGNWQESLTSLQKALEQAVATGQWRQIGETWNNIGLVQEQLTQTDAALDAYQSALAAYESLAKTGVEGDVRDAKIGEAKTLNNLGGIYLNLQQPEAALGFLERSLVLLREVNLPEEESLTLRNLGGLYPAVNRFADGIQALQQSLALEKSLGNTPAQLIIHERLAALYTQVGALPEALRMLEEAIPLAKASGNPEVEAILLSQVGEVQELAGDYEGSILSYESSVNLLETFSQTAVDEQSKAQTQTAIVELLTRLGSLQETLGNIDEAIVYYQNAIDRISQTENPLFWGELMVSLGQLYSQQEDWTAAEKTYTAALAVVEPLQVPLAQAQLLRGLGSVYQAQDQFPQALAALQQALALQQQVKGKSEVAPELQQQEEGLTLNLLGDLYQKQQQYEAALTQYQAAYQALQTGRDALGQGDTLRDVGLTQLLRNTPQDAVEPLVLAVQLWQLLSYQTGRLLEPSVEAHQLLQAALIRSEQPALALVSAEDERSFPIRLSQAWSGGAEEPGAVRATPPQPLSLEQIQGVVAAQQKPLVFYDLASEPGATPGEVVAKLRIWLVLPSGEITLRELSLSAIGINTPEDLIALVNASLSENPDAAKRSAALTQLSDLLLTPITLDLATVDLAAVDQRVLQLVIPPLFLSIPFSDLTFTDSSNTVKALGDRFQLDLYPSILAISSANVAIPE